MKKYTVSSKDEDTLSNSHFKECEKNELPYIDVTTSEDSIFCNLDWDVITFFKTRQKNYIHYLDYIKPLYFYYVSKTEELKDDFSIVGGSKNAGMKILKRDIEKIANFTFDYLLQLKELDLEKEELSNGSNEINWAN